MKKTIFLLLASALLLSCASGRRHVINGNQTENRNFLTEVPAENMETIETKEHQKNRKVIFSTDISLLVKNVDKTNSQILEILKKYDGYVNESSIHKITMRVKSSTLDQVINEVSDLGKVHKKHVNGKDVTEKYLDYQIRLENATKARDRYLALFERAESIEETLRVERELERLNEKIDLLKGKINRINHLSEFSTITVRLKEKKKPGLIGYLGIGVYKTIKWLFVRN